MRDPPFKFAQQIAAREACKRPELSCPAAALPHRAAQPRQHKGLRGRRREKDASFDHLVGAGEDRWRHGEAERLGGVEIMPVLTESFGSRTAAGLVGSTWPVISQSNKIRTAAS